MIYLISVLHAVLPTRHAHPAPPSQITELHSVSTLPFYGIALFEVAAGTPHSGPGVVLMLQNSDIEGKVRAFYPTDLRCSLRILKFLRGAAVKHLATATWF